MATFKHSGKIGDIIYSLPTVRALGGGSYYVQASFLPGFYEADAQAVLPLIQAQPYISTAALYSGEKIEVDLDRFRPRAHQVVDNLADSHLYVFGLATEERDKAWLTAPASRVPPVAFARSRLRRGIQGFWEQAYALFGKQAFFIGLPEDHAEFHNLYGPIPYFPTANMLEVASLLAGAKLFIGDQSSPRAIAEGLKKPVIQEVCPASANCSFSRPGLMDVTLGVHLQRMETFAHKWLR